MGGAHIVALDGRMNVSSGFGDIYTGSYLYKEEEPEEPIEFVALVVAKKNKRTESSDDIAHVRICLLIIIIGDDGNT